MTTGRLDFEAYNCDPDKTTSTPGFRRDVWLAVVARGAAAVRDVRVTITAPDGCVIDSGASGQGPTPNRITVPLFGELTGGEGQGWRLGITAPKSVVVPSGVVTLQVEVEGTDVATGGSVRRVGTHQVVFPFPDVDLPAAFTVTGTGGNPLVVGVPSTLTVTLTTRKGWVENTLVRAYLPLCLSFGSSKSGGRAVEDGRVVEWDLQRLDHRHDLDFTVSADDDIEPRDVNRVLDVVVTSSDATAGLFQFRPEVSFDPTLDVVVGDPVTVERGSTAKFAFRVADGKGSPAYGTRVSAVLPPGVTFTDATPAPTSTGRTITWELPTVKAGDGEAFTVSGKVAPNAGSELDCRVTADCAAGIGLQDSRQASGTVRVKVEDLARLEFTRHVAVPETVVPGKKGQDDVVYRWTVVNHGPCPAKAVEVDVELPGELTGQHASSGGGRNGANGWRWSVGDLAVAATRDVEAGGVVAAGFSGALVATATAKTATRTDTGPVVSRVTAHSDAQVVLDLPSGYATPAKVLTDSDLTFIWAFAAKGPSTATNVKVTVTLPDGVDLHPGYRDKPEAAPKKVDGNRYEITLGDQAAGATGYVAVVTKVKDTASGTMTATATVTADDLTTAVPPRDLTATVASRQDGGRKQDHSTSWWSAFLAALLGLGALLLTPPVPPSDASGDTTDDDDDEDEDKKKKRTRLRLTGKSSEDEPAAASDVTLTWEVANRGKNYPATALTVDVTVPEGLTITSTSPSDGTATDTGIGAVLWEIPELATDRKATLEIKATVAADPPGSVRVIASASALNAPLTTKSVTVKPRRKAKWELSEGEVKPQPATIGSKAAFSWTVTNRGPSTADKPALVVTVPDGLEDPVVTAGGKTVTTHRAEATLTGTFPDPVAAKSDPVRVTVEGTVRKAASGKLTTGVDISASDADPNHLKGSATADVKAVLAVRGSAPDQVVAGGSLTYRWSVTDTSTAAAREVELSMPLPPAGQATFVSASHGVTPQQNELRWPLGTIAPKASRDAVAEFRLTHDAPIGALHGVAATAKGANADSVTSAAVAPTVGAGTHLDLTASVSPAEAAPGDTVVFTWTLANSGLSDAADLRIDVPVPNGVLAKTAVLAGPTGTVPTGQPVPVAALAPGHPVKITLTGEIGLQDQGVVATTATVAEGGHPTGLAATASVSVTPSAKLTLTPKAGPVTTAAGTRADLVWTVAKTGRGAVRDAYVFVDPPPGLDVVALRIGTRSAAQVADGARVSGQLDDPGDVPITVTATVAVDAGFGGDDATVRAWLSPEAAPPKTTPSETTVAVTRSSAITLWHQDSQPTPLVAGRRGTLFWDIANAGPSDAAGLTAAVTLPATVEPGDATVNTHPAELVRQGTSWQVAVDAVAAEESAQVCVTVSVPASDTGTTVAAPVTVTGTGLTTTTQGGSDHPLTRESALTATTTAAPDRAQTGSDATYTWQLSNKGPSTAAKVVYEATFTPAGTSITVDPVDGGVSAKQGNATVVTWTVDLEPARHKDFSAIVTFGAEAGSLQVDSTSRLDGKRTTSTQSTTAVTTPALVPSGLPAAAPGA